MFTKKRAIDFCILFFDTGLPVRKEPPEIEKKNTPKTPEKLRRNFGPFFGNHSSSGFFRGLFLQG